MMPRRRAVLLAGLLAAFQGRAPAELLFTLAFEGVPETLTGSPGEPKAFEAYVTLTTTGNDLPLGAQGWSISVLARGGTIPKISLEGIHVSTIFEDDWDPSTAPLDPYDFDLKDASVRVAQSIPASGQVDDPHDAAISAVMLNSDLMMVLQPVGIQRIARLRVEAQIPAGGDCLPLELLFRDGLGHFHLPIPNVVTFERKSFQPYRRSATVLLCPPSFRRGDSNADGAVDISDAIYSLGFLYLGGPEPPCRDAADVNDDAMLDISDAVFLLSDLFSPWSRSLIPVPGPYECGRDPGPEWVGCRTSPACPP